MTEQSSGATVFVVFHPVPDDASGDVFAEWSGQVRVIAENAAGYRHMAVAGDRQPAVSLTFADETLMQAWLDLPSWASSSTGSNRNTWRDLLRHNAD